MIAQTLINYYIIDRINGISYEPYLRYGNALLVARSNKATITTPVYINVNRLVKGLQEKRYRLILKSL